MTARKIASRAPLQDILVYADTSPASGAALRYADAIAGDGNITCLMLGLLAPYPMTIYMEASPDVWLQAQRKADEVADEAEAKVRAMAAEVSHATEIRRRNVMEGEAGRVLGIQGRYADAILIGWRGKEATTFDRNLFSGALFNAGAPVILVPETFRAAGAPEKILVAWSPEREAARAVHDALPLLKAAGEVRVVTVATGDPASEEDPGADIGRHLARHDVKVEVKQIPAGSRSTAELIQDEARYLGADMIVMGGYGHSRLAQWVMGGMTRDMLATLPVPVLFSH